MSTAEQGQCLLAEGSRVRGPPCRYEGLNEKSSAKERLAMIVPQPGG